MAGGKETPRQRMIGMMYLVLTALLALNISNAVLEKFVIIDATLKSLVEEDDAFNKKIIEAINSSTASNDEVKAAQEKAVKIRELGETVRAAITKTKEGLVTQGGKRLEGEELILNGHRPEEYMLRGDKGSPEGQAFEKALDEYTAGLAALGFNFPKLTKTVKDYPEFDEKMKKEHGSKSFLFFTFQGTPLMAALATLTQMETEVLDLEKKALDSLLKITKGEIVEVDQLIPLVQAESNTLVAGQKYTGNLFLAGSASGVKPEMFKDGRPLPMEEVNFDGIKVLSGKIEFTAQGGNYNAAGVSEQQFATKINFQGKTVEKNIKYRVLKPTAQFGSAAAATLYKDCGNVTNVTIPGLTDLSGLSLSVPGDQGSVQRLAPGKFAIIPTRGECNVSVLLNGQSIGSQRFTTQDVPMPVAKIMAGAAEIDQAKGIPAGTGTIRVEPEILDKIFKDNNGDDNKYFVTRLTLQINGGSPIAVNSGTIQLSQYGLRKGDNITISQVQVQRNKYGGGNSQVNGSRMSLTVRIN